MILFSSWPVPAWSARQRPWKGWVLLLLAGLLLLWPGLSLLPAQAEADPDGVPVVPGRVSRIVTSPLNVLYSMDTTPRGDRIPVILVPGRAQEYQADSWWEGFYDRSQRDPFFKAHYKPYVFLYNSNQELVVQGSELSLQVRRHLGNQDKPLVFISYSLGGNIVREAMKDARVFDQTAVIFGIAVPYHGSPVFNPRWFTSSVRPVANSPIRKTWDKLLYRTYMFDKNNLVRYLQWDNFDGSMPQFEAHDANPDPAMTITRHTGREQETRLKQKLILYASYLENPYTRISPNSTPASPLSKLGRSASQAPKTLLNALFPYYGITIHSVMKTTNYMLSNLSTFTRKHPEGKNTRLYRLNDGVIPLSSMLYLPERPLPYQEGFWQMARQMDVPRARLFPNLDHLDIGEYRKNKRQLRTPDLIHTEEGLRTPYGWLLYDLAVLQPGLADGGKLEAGPLLPWRDEPQREEIKAPSPPTAPVNQVSRPTKQTGALTEVRTPVLSGESAPGRADSGNLP
jgi:hypothetical protein